MTRSLPLLFLVAACSQGGSGTPPVMTGGATIIECAGAKRAALPAGTCKVTPGSAALAIKADVLLPGEVLHGGTVATDASGNIVCAGCDCAKQIVAGATAIDCPTGVISPGLINPHDHIGFTQNAPAADSGERYEQRHDWRKGLRGHTKISSAGGASADQLAWGELRFLLGGATSMVGGSGAPGLVRNLDVAAMQGGLNHAPVTFDTFPLGDSSGAQLPSGCAYKYKETAASLAMMKAYEPHVAEGVDGVAHNEFVCSSSVMGGALDLTLPQTAIIHAIGLQPADYQLMAMEGTSLIWSPRSNVRLYGDTAQVTVAARLGVRIALGTDWTPSGSMNLLRELRCADELNQNYYGKYFSDEQLWELVTFNAARVTATDDAIGVLGPGHLADLTIFNAATHRDYRAVIAAAPADVVLVMRAGKPLYGDAPLVAALNAAGCDALDVCGTMKSVCLMSEVGKSYDALKAAAGTAYGAFFCDTPPGEPTCVPSRPTAVMGSSVYTGKATAGDQDGDGVPDAMDDCPTVFNPIRVVDSGKQADADQDGVGDACDVCPLQPHVTTCPTGK